MESAEIPTLPVAEPMPPKDAASTGVVVAFAGFADWQPWRKTLSESLDGAETARVDRMRRPHDREGLAIAYGLHRWFLSQWMGVPARRVPLGRDARGCPCLPSTAWRTSLSHAEGAVAFALTAAGPVGIDLEPWHRRDVVNEISTRILHPGDGEALSDTGLLATWVRKEAYLKAAGVGLMVDMETFAAPDGAILPLAQANADARGDVLTRLLDLHPDYCAALSAPPGVPVAVCRLVPAGRVPD